MAWEKYIYKPALYPRRDCLYLKKHRRDFSHRFCLFFFTEKEFTCPRSILALGRERIWRFFLSCVGENVRECFYADALRDFYFLHTFQSFLSIIYIFTRLKIYNVYIYHLKCYFRYTYIIRSVS